MFPKSIDKIIDLLFTSVVSEGGDGDAIWLSRFHTLEQIENHINEYDEKVNTGWKITKNGDTINWGHNQEYVVITTNEQYYNEAPDWTTLKIKF